MRKEKELISKFFFYNWTKHFFSTIEFFFRSQLSGWSRLAGTSSTARSPLFSCLLSPWSDRKGTRPLARPRYLTPSVAIQIQRYNSRQPTQGGNFLACVALSNMSPFIYPLVRLRSSWFPLLPRWFLYLIKSKKREWWTKPHPLNSPKHDNNERIFI